MVDFTAYCIGISTNVVQHEIIWLRYNRVLLSPSSPYLEYIHVLVAARLCRVASSAEGIELECRSVCMGEKAVKEPYIFNEWDQIYYVYHIILNYVVNSQIMTFTICWKWKECFVLEGNNEFKTEISREIWWPEGKSISGLIFFLFGDPIFWKTKKKKMKAYFSLSLAEAT
jgi:hypothetical protein